MNLKKLYENPLIIFWYPIPIIILVGLIMNGTLGIQMQETLVETTTLKFSLFISGLLLFSGLAYYFFKEENRIPGLTRSHIQLTLAGAIILLILILLQDNSAHKQSFEHFFRIDPREWLVILLFGLGLIIYFINGSIAFFISLKLFRS